MRLAILVLGFMLLAATASAATLQVNPDGSGDQPTLWAAMLAASDGDVIELGDGVFTGDGNRDFLYFRAVTLRSQSGNAANCVIDPQGSAGDPHRAFTVAGGGAGSRIENITFRNGYADGVSVVETTGACILCTQGAAPTISGCRFESSYAGRIGGGVGLDYSGEVTLVDCVFSGLEALEDGAGVGGAGGGAALVDCWFTGCDTSFNGGFCVFLSEYDLDFTYSIEDCDFVGNACGGVYTQGGAELRRCRFEELGYTGALLSAAYGDVDLAEDCVFRACTGGSALSLGRRGGAGGPNEEIVVRRCLFYENVSDEPTLSMGGLLSHLHDLTFWNNDSPGAMGFPGGLEHVMTVLVERVIVAGGTSSEAVVCGDGMLDLTIRCSDFHGGWDGCAADWLGVDGNIDADPMFCDAAAGDFTLHASSPCFEVNNGCGTMGAYDVGCGTTGVEDSSFGAIKALY